MLAQQFVKDLAPAGRLGNKQYGLGAGIDNALQTCSRGGSFRFYAQIWQWVGRKAHLMFRVIAAKHNAPAFLQALIEFIRAQVELLRGQNRAFYIVAQRFIAAAMSCSKVWADAAMPSSVKKMAFSGR